MGFPRIAFFAFLVLSISLALWKGGKPERAGALVIVVMTALQFAWRVFSPRHFNTVDLSSVVVDATGVIGFGLLAVYAHRFWPIWAASLQVLSLSSHFARGVELSVKPLVYALMKSMPTFLVLFVLMLGTLFHQLRLRKQGFDRSWTEW